MLGKDNNLRLLFDTMTCNMHRFKQEMSSLKSSITYEIEVPVDHPAHSQFGKSSTSATALNLAKAKSAPIKQKVAPPSHMTKQRKKMFKPAPAISQQEMHMIYTMGALTDCMPVNMTFEPQQEEVPEFTVTHLDESVAKEYEELEEQSAVSEPEIRMITVDMKNNFEDGIGQVYTGEPQYKPDVHIKMSSDTFDRISNNELSGFRAFVSGKVKMNGCLMTLKKFDKEVILNPKYKI